MGSCVSSVHKKSSSVSAGSALNLVTFGSKRDKLVTPAYPIKPAAPPIAGSPPMDSGRRENFGTKDEMFFDSQMWLESDCEDDFFSVNGEFTPSRGTTPVHHSLTVNETPPETADRNLTSDAVIKQPSPTVTDNKKKLLELFRESLDEDGDHDNVAARGRSGGAKAALPVMTRSSAPATPYVSGTSSFCGSERMANGGGGDSAAAENHRRVGYGHGHGCIPRLVSCGSFSERRRRAMSPAVSVDGKS